METKQNNSVEESSSSHPPPVAPSASSNNKNGDILRFTPHNFHQSIAVHFPPQRLPVCEKCKRNFKTRDICRTRLKHTGLPWTTAYVCITLGETCTTIGEDNGKQIYNVGQSLTARTVVTNVQQQNQPRPPYNVKGKFSDPSTPCCEKCKKANRTRKFCREVHGHRNLPWTTVYVVLSAKEKGDDDDEGRTIPHLSEGKKEKNKDGDDIQKIAPSRTFLTMISKKHNSVHWLELGTTTVTGKASAPPIAGGSLSSQPTLNAMAISMSIQQQSAAAAAWHAHNYMNQTMAMQPQNNTNKKRKRGKKQMSEEARAAVASANHQASTERNEQFMRQQFVNSQMQMYQAFQWQQQQQHHRHQQQKEDDNQSQPTKKRGRKKDNHLKEGNIKSSSSIDGSVANGDGGGGADGLPLVENPEETWFEESFDLK